MIIREVLKHKSIWLRRSDVARNLGIPISKLKYYTKEGLFKIVGTTEGGMTLYDLREVTDQYRKIERLKKVGKTLSEIKDCLCV